MTWNPLKKKLLTIRPTPVPPLIPADEDHELDVSVMKLMQFEDIIKILIKKAKRYLQQISILNDADQNLSNHLSECGLVHINDELRTLAEDYLSVTSQSGKLVPNIKELYITTMVDPLKKYRDELIGIEANLSKREELAAQWRIVYSRVQKLQEKKDRMASNIAKLSIESRTADDLGEKLKECHKNLLTTLNNFIDRRMKIIQPCIRAMIMIQLDYYGNMTKMYTYMMNRQNVSDTLKTNFRYITECNEAITNEMTRIKDLTITKTS